MNFDSRKHSVDTKFYRPAWIYRCFPMRKESFESPMSKLKKKLTFFFSSTTWTSVHIHIIFSRCPPKLCELLFVRTRKFVRKERKKCARKIRFASLLFNFTDFTTNRIVSADRWVHGNYVNRQQLSNTFTWIALNSFYFIFVLLSLLVVVVVVVLKRFHPSMFQLFKNHPANNDNRQIENSFSPIRMQHGVRPSVGRLSLELLLCVSLARGCCRWNLKTCFY